MDTFQDSTNMTFYDASVSEEVFLPDDSFVPGESFDFNAVPRNLAELSARRQSFYYSTTPPAKHLLQHTNPFRRDIIMGLQSANPSPSPGSPVSVQPENDTASVAFSFQPSIYSTPAFGLEEPDTAKTVTCSTLNSSHRWQQSPFSFFLTPLIVAEVSRLCRSCSGLSATTKPPSPAVPTATKLPEIDNLLPSTLRVLEEARRRLLDVNDNPQRRLSGPDFRSDEE